MTARPPDQSTLRWTAMTHPGHKREGNEDTFLALTLDAETAHYLGKDGAGGFERADYIFAVGDGMGGAQAGEFASKIAIEKITKVLPTGFHSQTMGLSAGFQDLFETLYEEIHRALLYLGTSYQECSGMGTTLSLCWFSPEWMYYAHIGDSRLYYLPAGGGIKQLTRDDNHIGWLYHQGKITERQARAHPGRHSLQRALGGDQQFLTIQTGSVGYEEGDIFVLCSDGVTDGLWEKHFVQLLRQPDSREAELSPAPRLIEAALSKSGQDNTTAIVIEASRRPDK